MKPDNKNEGVAKKVLTTQLHYGKINIEGVFIT